MDQNLKYSDSPARPHDDACTTKGKKAAETPHADEAQEQPTIEAFEEEGAGIAAKE
jgi:hypothetical protein